MKMKYFAAGVLTVALVIFAVGAKNTGRDISKWEYAVFSKSNVCWVWASPEQTVKCVYEGVSKTSADFAGQMNLPTVKDLTTNELLNNLSNKVGQDGWELVNGQSEANGETILYFKRPLPR